MRETKRAGAPAGRFSLFIRLCMALGIALISLPLLMASSSSAAAPGQKVVVCKYVSTPGGVLDHVVVVGQKSLGNANSPWPGTFPFSWTDAHGGTLKGSTAIRFAAQGEQAKDIDPAECVQSPIIDDCPDLAGDQPVGFQCFPLEETEQRDVGPTLDCDTETVTTLHQERTRTQTFDDQTQTWSFGDWSDWTTVSETVDPATDQQCGGPIDPPEPPDPVDPPEPTLPNTGAGDYLGGLAALSGLLLAAAGTVLFRSRKIGLNG